VTGRRGIARTKIAFKVTRNNNSELYVADYDGHNATPVTQDNSVVAAPAWQAGRRVLYYTTYKFGNADIVSQDLDSGVRKIIARYGGSNISPAPSPDGRFVAMILSKGGSPDLYVANADGSGVRQLTRTGEDESSPCWSPDSRTVCCATRMDGRRVLAKVRVDGGALQRLPLSEAINPTEPDWSPDGQYILLTSQFRDFYIYVVKASGGEARQLTMGEDGSWAPNSRTIIFTRRQVEEGRSSLCLTCLPNSPRISPRTWACVLSRVGLAEAAPGATEQHETRDFLFSPDCQPRPQPRQHGLQKAGQRRDPHPAGQGPTGRNERRAQTRDPAVAAHHRPECHARPARRPG
jgi:tol-pal system beta propeller repeat protein TolB